jgi:hypothetical protein
MSRFLDFGFVFAFSSFQVMSFDFGFWVLALSELLASLSVLSPAIAGSLTLLLFLPLPCSCPWFLPAAYCFLTLFAAM